ncbi:MAG: STAS domain-containing protein [Acidimicrobiales bacterium]
MSALPIRPSASPDDHGAPTDDGLTITVWHRHHLLEVRLDGELDVATAARFSEALGWVVRRRGDSPVVVDLTRVRFIDLAGHRALVAASARPDGTRDPRILWVLGPAVTRLERVLAEIARTG